MVIAIVNQKGGVGKSTTAVNLGAGIARSGLTVALIDMDPQSNTTSSLIGKPPKEGLTVYEVLEDCKKVRSAILKTGIENLYLLPSNINLAGAEIELVSAISRETRLKRALEIIRKDFDFIIVDCPPSLGLLTLNAMAAADSLIVPIQCEYFALEGLSKLLETYELVKENLNPRLKILGFLLTMYDSRTRLSQDVSEEVRNYFGEKVFSTVIPRSVRISEAPGFSKPIQEFAPNSKGALAYDQLAKEVISRAKKRTG